jgi:hypothetical protein
VELPEEYLSQQYLFLGQVGRRLSRQRRFLIAFGKDAGKRVTLG